MTKAEEDEEARAAEDLCASCGIAEVDNVKLEECDGCDLVKYCGDGCREWHRKQHEEECKKGQTKLHYKKLFTQPDGSNLGECPLCFLPLPLEIQKSIFYSCCSKVICDGCHYTNSKREFEAGLEQRCPFCREPTSDEEECKRRMMKRVKANDPAALSRMGAIRYDEGDWDTAVEYWTKAAELGDAQSHYRLGCMYDEGKGVEKDEEKKVYHMEKAAIGGHSIARYNLGHYEGRDGNAGRSVKHWIISANLGFEVSMKALWGDYKDGYITKEDLEATLRTHKAAMDAMKSPEREAAEAWRKRGVDDEGFAVGGQRLGV